MQIANALPGRVRYKNSLIYQNKSAARYINNYIDTLYGVKSCKVNDKTASIIVEYDDAKITLENLSAKINNIINDCLKNKTKELAKFNEYFKTVENRNKAKRNILIYGLIYIAFKIKQNLFGKFSISRNIRVLQVASIVTIVGGYPLLKSLYKKFAKYVPADSDILLKLTALSLTILRESNKGILVLLLKEVNDYIKYSAQIQSQRILKNSSNEKINYVRLIVENNTEILTNLDSVDEGSIIIVSCGELIPVEGKVLSGNAIVSCLYNTGQSVIMNISKNSNVTEYMHVISGTLKIKARKKPQYSQKKDIDLKTLEVYKQIKEYQEKITSVAFLAAALSYFITGDIMNIFSCLLVITPGASMVALNSGISNYVSVLNKKDIYIKNINTFEKAAKVNSIAFDKTGTLTQGTMKIIDIEVFQQKYTKQELLKICAACEIHGFHPISVALKSSVDFSEELNNVEYSVYIPTKGIKAIYQGKKVIIGNEKMMIENNINIQPWALKYKEIQKNLYTPVFVSIDNEICGIIVLQDIIRKDSIFLIQLLKYHGFDEISIITGDSKQNAWHIAQKLQIENVYAECSLQKKKEIIENLRKDRIIMMAGDGLNDIIAMEEADVSVSVCTTLCDRVFSYSDCIILKDSLDSIADFIIISQKSYKAINNTITFSKLYNIVLGAIAVFGHIDAFTAKTLNTLNSLYVLLLNTRIKYFNADIARKQIIKYPNGNYKV